MNQNFIKVNQNQLDVDIDLRYASKNNFTGNKIYFSESSFLHKIAYQHLSKAVDIPKKIGFKIFGWSRTRKNIEGIRCLHGTSGLKEVLQNSEILILLLPLILFALINNLSEHNLDAP